MKLLLAFLAFAAAPALACPPTPPRTPGEPIVDGPLMYNFSQASNVVYGQLIDERPERVYINHVRQLRVFHSYRGDLVAGEVVSVNMVTPVCPTLKASFDMSRGAYGVILLIGQSQPFDGGSFLSAQAVDELIAAGAIESAND